ncbi:MAG: hypothetical protein HY303_11565 [Candidatus Wallbacteria bacterium]|nr:hypothetical protein [Candidatus Wallbacteria bacterium]
MSGGLTVLAREQEAMFEVFRRHGKKGMRLLHVDQHCDMRGWVVDVEGRRARWLRGCARLDSGNVLAHAVREGWVTSVVWLHDPAVGRQADIGTFLTVEEAGRWPWRWKTPGEDGGWSRFELQEVTHVSRSSLEGVDALGLDWDHFAPFWCLEADARSRVEQFLGGISGPFPELIFMCASPGYASAHVGLFEELAGEVARRQGGTVERFDEPWGGVTGSGPSGRCLAAARRFARAGLVGLKRVVGVTG